MTTKMPCWTAKVAFIRVRIKFFCLFVSLVLSLLCVYYIRMLCRHVCFVSNNLVADECDRVVLDKTALCMDTLCIQQCDKCDESTSRLCVRQIDVEKEIKFRSRYMMFGYHCNINNPEYHVRRRFDREPSRIPVKKLGKLSSGVDIRH